MLMLKKSIFIVVALFFVACGNKQKVDVEQADVLLYSLYDKMIDLDYDDISLSQIDSLIKIYSSSIT